MNQTRGVVVVAVLLLISVGFIADHRLAARRKRSELALQSERLRVVHLTIRTVQDIVNNSLNQLQLLRLEAEGLVPTESVTVFDRTIQDVVAKVTALGNIKTFAENQMQIAVGHDYRPNSSQQTP